MFLVDTERNMLMPNGHVGHGAEVYNHILLFPHPERLCLPAGRRDK